LGAVRLFIRPSIPEKFESRALLHWAFTEEGDASMAHTGKLRTVFAMDTTKLPPAAAMSRVQIFHCVYLLIPEAPSWHAGCSELSTGRPSFVNITARASLAPFLADMVRQRINVEEV
jgi:hypothetical protein